MFSTVWKISMVPNPTQMRLPMVPLAIRAVWKQRQTSRNSRIMIARHPTIPSSSPHTAKMKSVCRSGRFSAKEDWVWMPVEKPLTEEPAGADSHKAPGLLPANPIRVVAVVEKDNKPLHHMAG